MVSLPSVYELVSSFEPRAYTLFPLFKQSSASNLQSCDYQYLRFVMQSRAVPSPSGA